MKRLTLFILTLAAAASFSGCAGNVYRGNSMNVSDEMLGLRLVGDWYRDGYAARGFYSVFRDELQFEGDGTFRSARIWSNLPVEQRRTSIGTWTVSNGNLIQSWRKRGGRGYRTTISNLLETRRREIVFRDSAGSVESFHRQPASGSPGN